MKIVIDSNRVIAALIKDSKTRNIIFNSYFEFFAPEHILNEIEKYHEDILQKINVKQEEFDILLSLIFEHIKIVPKEEYNKLLTMFRMKIRDINDLPYLAVCLLIDADGIWTHDLDFKEQTKFKVLTNIDMLRLSKSKLS
nr:PIN domain-containing protein [Candidatus Woesearchaeota archaeon]